MRVVTQTVEVEVCGGFLPANENLVAMTFTCFKRHAGDEGKRFVQAGDTLVLQLVAGNHRNGLRYVDDAGRRLGRGRSVIDRIGVAIGRDENIARQVIALLLILGAGRGADRDARQGGQGGEQDGAADENR